MSKVGSVPNLPDKIKKTIEFRAKNEGLCLEIMSFIRRCLDFSNTPHVARVQRCYSNPAEIGHTCGLKNSKAVSHLNSVLCSIELLCNLIKVKFT